MVKSPISLPRSFSIGVSAMRPTCGTRFAITCDSHSSAPAPGHLELAVVGDLDEPDARAHRLALGGHVAVGVRAVEGDLLVRLGRARREPQRVLEPAVVAEHRMLGLQPLVDRRGAQRPCRRGAPRSGSGCESAASSSRAPWRWCRRASPSRRSARRPSPRCRRPGSPSHHPVRQREADAAALAEAGHHAAGDPEIAQAADRARPADCRRARR